MLSAQLCLSFIQLLALIALVWGAQELRDDVQALQQQVNDMTEASAQIRQDLADIKSEVVGLADAYTNAAAARLQKALDDQKAAIEAENAADLAAAHKDAQDVIAALKANAPITPPATAEQPSPTPVPSPADPASTNNHGPAGSQSAA